MNNHNTIKSLETYESVEPENSFLKIKKNIHLTASKTLKIIKNTSDTELNKDKKEKQKNNTSAWAKLKNKKMAAYKGNKHWPYL